MNINISMNKYEKWYKQITERGRTRRKTRGMETHHIIPKCLGGTDSVDNLANVTFREHFICHWLLTKIHYGKERHRLLKALWMMKADRHTRRYKTKITSRVYAALKEEYAALQSACFSGPLNPNFGKKWTDEQKIEHGNKIKGRVQLESEKLRQVAAMTGCERAEFDDEWKENLSKNHKSKQPGFDGSLKESTKKLIGDKIRGRKHSDKEKKRRADAIRGSKRDKKLCPHCNKEIAVNQFSRWHGDNCKQNPINQTKRT